MSCPMSAYLHMKWSFKIRATSNPNLSHHHPILEISPQTSRNSNISIPIPMHPNYPINNRQASIPYLPSNKGIAWTKGSAAIKQKYHYTTPHTIHRAFAFCFFLLILFFQFASSSPQSRNLSNNQPQIVRNWQAPHARVLSNFDGLAWAWSRALVDCVCGAGLYLEKQVKQAKGAEIACRYGVRRWRSGLKLFLLAV